MTAKRWWPGERQEDVARARDSISDIHPPPLRDRIDQRLAESRMTAGMLTRLAAWVTERDAALAELNRRVVGVQLIYEGLTLTRALVRVPPWGDEPENDSNLDILVAHILVAKGFTILARTEAAPEAIETLRAFGRDETRRLDGSESDLSDRALETDVYELSIVAGVTATGASRPAGTRDVAKKLSGPLDIERVVEDEQFSESVIDELDGLVWRTD